MRIYVGSGSEKNNFGFTTLLQTTAKDDNLLLDAIFIESSMFLVTINQYFHTSINILNVPPALC